MGHTFTTSNERRARTNLTLDDSRRRIRWPRLIAELAAATADSPEAVAGVAVMAARPLLGAEIATVVRWQDGHPMLLDSLGELPLALTPRPPEGMSWSDGRPVATVSIDPRTDLIVSRSAAVPFDGADLEALRALGQLVHHSWLGCAPGLALARMAARVVSSLEPDEVLVALADATAHLLRADIAGVLLRCPDDELEMRCAIGNTRFDTGRLRIRPGQGLAGRVALAGRPERIDDYSTDPRSAPEFLALSDVEGTCSAIAVPLSWENRVIGVLCAWRRHRVPFTNEDESVFATLAELCVGSLHNAEAHRALRLRADAAEAARNELAERHKHAVNELAVHTELLSIAAEGTDVEAILTAVSRLMTAAAAVISEDGRVLGTATNGARRPSAKWLDHVRGAVMSAAADGDSVAEYPAGEQVMLIARVRASGMTFGHLALLFADTPPAGARLAAEQAAVVTALFLAQKEAAVAAGRRAQSEFVWDVLEGRVPDAVEAGVRARHLGMGFALPARVVAIELHRSAETASHAADPEQLERARVQCSRLISSELERYGARNAVLARRADRFAIIVPRVKRVALPALRRLATTFATLTWPDDLSARVGVGGVVREMTGMPTGWQEALLACSAALPGHAPGLFEDLGVLRFLLAPANREDLESFARQVLGPVLDYDASHGSELLRTLRAYLTAGCSTRQTASMLCVHHRTVAYRIQRVADLTGLRLADQESRFEAQLACKILALSGQSPEPSCPKQTTISESLALAGRSQERRSTSTVEFS